MMIKNILSITLAFCFATSLYGAENKQMESNEFEVSKSEIMPKVTPPVIRDNKTETVYDPTTKLMWQDNSEVKSNDRKWQDAIAYCDNLTFGGYSDWRLPDIKELLSITDIAQYNLDVTIKNGFQNVNTHIYWSSSTNTKNSYYAWIFYVSGGKVEVKNIDSSSYVRCVRDSK
jgi:hypothetical protein